MAINKRYTHLNLTGSNHSQLDAEFAHITGTLVVGGAATFKSGLSGSLTQLTDGRSYLVAGPNVTITSESNGQITIEAAAGGGTGTNYWTESALNVIYASGSVLMRGADTTTSPTDYGTDLTFYVSGSTNAKSVGAGVAGFGGDVVISGNLYLGDPVLGASIFDANGFGIISSALNLISLGDSASAVGITGNEIKAGLANDLALSFTGSNTTAHGTLTALSGISGSLTHLADGTSYLIAGANVTITTESNGAITIAATDTVGTNYWTESSLNHIHTTGSADVFVTSSFGAGISGSFGKYAQRGVVRIGAHAGGAELLRVGGLDLTPVTGTAQTLNSGGYPLSAVVSGSVLAPPAFRGYISPRAVIRNEVAVTAGSYFSTLADGQAELIAFSANYVVNCTYYNGTQYVKSVVEISRDVYDNNTAYGADWDANFNANGDVTVTGSVAGGVNPIFWHVQRVKQTGIITDATLDDFSASVAGEAF